MRWERRQISIFHFFSYAWRSDPVADPFQPLDLPVCSSVNILLAFSFEANIVERMYLDRDLALRICPPRRELFLISSGLPYRFRERDRSVEAKSNGRQVLKRHYVFAFS